MGQRFPRRLLAVPLMAAALAGCGGAGGAASGGPNPADVMPKSSALYVEAVVRPAGDQQRQVTPLLSKVMRTGDPGAKIRRIIDRKLADEQPGVTYEQDIEPWLGDRVGLTATRLATRRPVMLGAVTVTDAAAAKAFVAREERRERADRRRYGGTEYFVEPDGTATGVVEDFVVVAGTPAAFRGAVDTAKGDGLSDAGRFSDAVDELPSDRLGLLYVDPQRIVDAAASNADATTAGVLRTAFRGLGVVTAFGRASADAVTVESRTVVDEGTPGAAIATLAAGGATELLKTLPAGTWAAYGIPKVGETLRSGLDGLGLGGALVAGQLQQQLGLDLQADLLSWMGDAAIFARGTRPGAVEGGLVVQATNPDRAAAALPRIIAAAQARGVAFRPVQLTGIPQAWAAKLPHGALVLARAGDRVVLAKGARAAVAAAVPSGATLGGSGLYDRARAALGGLAPVLVVDGPAVARLARAAARHDPHLAELRPYLALLDLVAAGTTRDGDTLRQRLTVKAR